MRLSLAFRRLDCGSQPHVMAQWGQLKRVSISRGALSLALHETHTLSSIIARPRPHPTPFNICTHFQHRILYLKVMRLVNLGGPTTPDTPLSRKLVIMRLSSPSILFFFNPIPTSLIHIPNLFSWLTSSHEEKGETWGQLNQQPLAPFLRARVNLKRVHLCEGKHIRGRRRIKKMKKRIV